MFSHCFACYSNTPSHEEKRWKANAYFIRGEHLFKKGEYRESARSFEWAYQTLPHYAVLINIALAYERAGEYPLAIEYFRKYLKTVEEQGINNPTPDIAPLLQETLLKVSELVISTSGHCDDCQIFVDDINRGAAPAQVIVHPGAHRVRLYKRGISSETATLSVQRGDTGYYTFDWKPSPNAGAPNGPNEHRGKSSPINPEEKTRDEANRKSALSIPFKAAVATTLVSGISASILWGTTLNTKNKFDNVSIIEKKEQLATKGEKLQNCAAAATVVAGAAAFTAIILATVDLTKSRKEYIKHNKVSLSVSPDTVGISIRF